MKEPIAPGELRVTTSPPSHPIRKNIIAAVACLTVLFIAFLGIRDIFFDDTNETPIAQHVIRIPPAPVPPIQIANLFVRWEGEITIGTATQNNVSLGFVYEKLVLTPVARLEDIPPSVRATAVNVQAGSLEHTGFVHAGKNYFVARQRSRKLSTLPLTIDSIGQDAQGLNSLVVQQAPVIIYGDVDVTTGPMESSDSGLAEILIDNGEWHSLYSELAAVRRPRGPPGTLAFEMEKGYRPTRAVYVVGKVKTYSGPDLHGHSVMKTKVIDLGLMTQDQRHQFDEALNRWHIQANLAAGNLHAAAIEPTISLESELESYAGRELVKTKSGGLMEKSNLLRIGEESSEEWPEILRALERIGEEAAHSIH